MAAKVFEFGGFRLDCEGFELRREGRCLKLERKPMELLILLAEKNGHLVSRTEIAERLWDREVFVDTEHGINTAIRKIREVLQDDPGQSRFVQTVTGKGYRFTAPIVEVRPSLTEEQSRAASAENRNRRVGDRKVAEGVLAEQDLAQGPGEMSGEVPRTRIPLRGWLVRVGAVVALGLVILGARDLRERSLGRTAGSKISSLAVLPLDNLSGDPGQDYFADGMTDELTTMLAKNSTLKVVSRTSVMQYKGAHRPLPEIARELGVDGVLEGSISRTGDKVHMTIQLIEAPSDTHVWAESYDRNAKDVVSLPREAAETIAKKLNSAVPEPMPSRYVNPEAHDAYLRGRYIWFSGDNEVAGRYFRKATELQPDYALGWAGLSSYYGQGVLDGELKPADSLPQEEAAAKRAVALDESLPEGHLAMGAAIFFNHWDGARAEHELARAVELSPGFAEAYHLHSKMLVALGRNEEALETERKAMELDPFQRPFAMGLAYFSVRQYDAAISEARLRLETRPEDVSLHWVLCETYRRKGALKEAAQEWEKIMLLTGDKETAASIRRAFDEGGYKAVLLRQIRYLKQRAATQYVSPVDMALQYAQLGRREETLVALEEGYRQRSPMLLWIQDDPAYDFLHKEERYRSIIRGLGLPQMY